jgi:hypothetical protein
MSSTHQTGSFNIVDDQVGKKMFVKALQFANDSAESCVTICLSHTVF